MEYIPLLLALPLLIGGGWVLGIVGFVKAQNALGEIRGLRAELALLRTALGTPAAAIAETVPVAPPAVEEPVAAIVPAVSPLEEPVPEAPVPQDQVPRAAEPDPLPLPPMVPRKTDFEELLTLRWGVWAGAVALLLAGVFLVRYAIDEGLLGPGPRCVLTTLLGAALIGGGEWLRRRSVPAASAIADQAPAALAAGGVAVLFGAAYAAGVLYALVPPLAGFVLMAAAAFAGLALSLRFGQLVAAVGLVGAFVTPALVATANPSLPGLFAYLLVVTAAALAVVRYTAWIWLGWATTVAGVLWVLLALVGSAPELWAAALFVPAAALLNLALLPPAALEHPLGRRLAWVPFAALLTVGLLLALAEPGIATRAAVLLMAPLAIAKGAAEPRLDRLPWLAAFGFLLLVLGWGLPPLQPVDNPLNAQELGEAIFPAVWSSDVLRPFLEVAALMAAFFAAGGLWFERRLVHPLHWSALAAAVPVLTLAIAYGRVTSFHPDGRWAAVAVLLAAALVFAAHRAIAEGDRQRAGVHAAGAAAALALGCAMLLSAQWLTLAVALFLPALAWIEARADLPALRKVGLAVALLVLVRLLLNWYVLDYADGQWPVANALLPAYLVPALAFGWAGQLFRRRADDLLVAVLEGGAAAFATILVALEIRQFAVEGQALDGDLTFWEAALHVSAMAVLATVSQHLAERSGRIVLGWVWRIQGGLALIGGTLLILFNPAFFDGNPVGPLPLLDALLPAYAVPALLALRACRLATLGARERRVLALYGLAASFAWVTLEVRHLFHRTAMGFGEAPVRDAELWSWSGAWLLFGFTLMAGGIRTGLKPLRLAALAVIALAAAKIFLIDMRDLVGLWRVLSFLGLGLALIGLGAVYRRFVVTPPAA